MKRISLLFLSLFGLISILFAQQDKAPEPRKATVLNGYITNVEIDENKVIVEYKLLFNFMEYLYYLTKGKPVEYDIDDKVSKLIFTMPSQKDIESFKSFNPKGKIFIDISSLRKEFTVGFSDKFGFGCNIYKIDKIIHQEPVPDVYYR